MTDSQQTGRYYRSGHLRSSRIIRNTVVAPGYGHRTKPVVSPSHGSSNSPTGYAPADTTETTSQERNYLMAMQLEGEHFVLRWDDEGLLISRKNYDPAIDVPNFLQLTVEEALEFTLMFRQGDAAILHGGVGQQPRMPFTFPLSSFTDVTDFINPFRPESTDDDGE